MRQLRTKRFILRSISAAYNGRIVVTRDGHRFRVFVDPIMGRLVLRKDYEPVWSDWCRRYLIEGDCCVDVGANFGFYSVLMGDAVSKVGTVLAFEPNPAMGERLLENLRLNGLDARVNVRKIALGSAPSRGQLHTVEQSTGLAYVEPGEIGDCEIGTLGKEMERHRSDVALIKIDIEGGEPAALEGGESLYDSADPPVTILEINRPALLRSSDDALDRVMAFINRNSLEVFGGSRAGFQRVVELAEAPPSNYLLVPDSGRFGDRARETLSA